MTEEKNHLPQSLNPADRDWARFWQVPPADVVHWPANDDASSE